MSFARALRAVGGVAVTGALLFGAAPVAVADETRDAQWPLESFLADQVWKESTGKGVTVAVVDDAVKGDHPDLRGNVLPGKDIVNGGTADRESLKDHGTAMASDIAGHGHGAGNADGVKGLAPDAKILPIAVPELGNSDSLGEAVRYAADHGASVINLSLGPSYLSPSVERALAYAAGKDVLIVAATGNESKSDIGPLAKAPGVLSVGAVDQYGKVWEKSNYGEGLLLTAPGVHIRSAAASEPYQQASGTSDAAAYVSAAAALLRSKFPNLTAGQIANRLVKTAGMAPKLEGTQLPDPHYGYGFIRPLRALKQDIPAGPKNGPLKAPEVQPSAGANAAGGGNQQAGGKKDAGMSTGVLVGVGVGVLAVIAIIVIAVVVSQKKNRRNGPPPGGPGGPGGWGGPGGPGGAPYPPHAYQQQPGAPGAYPYPPQQPPAQ